MGSGDELVVEISGLTKSFGSKKVLDGLDLSIPRGSVTGFLGPNGAGKSTTIRVLLGTYRWDAGTVRLLGGHPVEDAVRLHRDIAYVPGEVNLWPELTGGECIDLLLSLRGVTVSTTRRAELIDRFELDPTTRVSAYSKGNRQKVVLVAAFAVRPRLFIFDEPTSGLDPLMENIFGDCVREAAAAGTSVLLSSHILGEVSRLCDAVTIIRAGRTVEAGSLQALRHLARSRVSVDVLGSADRLRDIPGVTEFDSVTTTPEISTVSFGVVDDQLPAVIEALSGLSVRRLSVTPPTLEELFLAHYTRGG
ncbi:ABC transporter ATP-binding protein [Williamsia sp. CHRR-6]|uniref:ABC transporter ATP-binding protein n=1 Tax=Williamsia sp. CHRR-6 TaxID=2835871 RepID=UPI001BD93D96|nr:ABC transporter ATP-binding protein [Williamsia sp. CHRR-6]MBT0566423.1 ABC transporter ATP-binding protein [Williamsia sp. CHRR-6]